MLAGSRRRAFAARCRGPYGGIYAAAHARAGVSGWLSFWAASPARCGEAGRAASWNLVAEESSSVRADACRDGWRGSLMDAKTLLVSYRSLARFFGCTPLCLVWQARLPLAGAGACFGLLLLPCTAQANAFA